MKWRREGNVSAAREGGCGSSARGRRGRRGTHPAEEHDEAKDAKERDEDHAPRGGGEDAAHEVVGGGVAILEVGVQRVDVLADDEGQERPDERDEEVEDPRDPEDLLGGPREARARPVPERHGRVSVEAAVDTRVVVAVIGRAWSDAFALEKSDTHKKPPRASRQQTDR